MNARKEAGIYFEKRYEEDGFCWQDFDAAIDIALHQQAKDIFDDIENMAGFLTVLEYDTALQKLKKKYLKEAGG